MKHWKYRRLLQGPWMTTQVGDSTLKLPQCSICLEILGLQHFAREIFRQIHECLSSVSIHAKSDNWTPMSCKTHQTYLSA